MKSLIILCTILFIGAFAQDSDVLTLTAENFDAALQDNSLVLVEFYAPWCGHCKKLAPEWEKAATELKNKGINAKLAAVDADDQKNTDLRVRYDIKGFPTLKLFRNGVPTDYNGERVADGIINYLKKQAAPASTPLTDAAAATAFADSDRLVIVGFFDSKDSEDYTKFLEVANKYRDSFTFGEVVGNADVNKALEVETTPSVMLYKQYDEKKALFGGHQTANLTEFILYHSIPIIDEIGPHNFKRYIETGKPLAYLFVDLTVEGQKDTFVGHVKELAAATRDKLNWVFIDSSKYIKHGERLGLSGKTIPALAIEKMEEGLHYAYDELAAIAPEGVTTWVNKFLAGEVPPTIKSEEIPTDNSAPVRVLVAKNFDEVVNDETKDVLVEFYAPWCGHCKKLAPVYDELAASLKETHPNVIIAKIDATLNDISPKHEVRGFPTIKLFPAKTKSMPLNYEGDRSLDDLLKYVKDHATVSDQAGATMHASVGNDVKTEL